MKHDLHKNCGNADCGGSCNLCCLAVCKVCKAYEGSLTTECPLVIATSEQQDLVYAGKLDFINGKWVEIEKPSN